MEPDEQRQLLNAGIQAVKANDYALARIQLLRVLEADSNNEPAWLWLSAALEDPRDQLMALERVLDINPRHPQALAAARALRQKLSLSSAVAPSANSGLVVANSAEPPSAAQPAPAENAPAPVGVAPAAVASTAISRVLPAAGYDMVSSEDDPYQCAYCGKQTHPDDERCRFCGRNLLLSGPWHGGGYLYLALLATGVQLQWALAQALASYLVTTYPEATRNLPLSWLWTSQLLLPAVLRAIAWAVALLWLLWEFEGSYGTIAIVALLDLVWAGAGYRFGFLPEAQAAVNAGLALAIFVIGLFAVISQTQSRQRLRVVPDRGLEAGVMFHRRALVYARRGMWALAALHWRRAVSRSPAEPIYYKALGRADARLGRYAEAVKAFKSGAEAAPTDQEFNRLIEKVRAHARSS